MFEGKEIRVQKLVDGFAIVHEDGRIYTERDIRGLQVHVANALCCASLIAERVQSHDTAERSVSIGVPNAAYQRLVDEFEALQVTHNEEKARCAIALKRLNDLGMEVRRLESELALAKKTNVHHHHHEPKPAPAQETGSDKIPPRPSRKKKSRR